MLKIYIPALLLFTSLAFSGSQTKSIYLDTLDINQVSQSQSMAQKNKSFDGTPISINGKRFERGIGTHAYSSFLIDLHGTCEKFSAFVGSPRKAEQGGSIIFKIIGDDNLLWQSPVVKAGDDALPVDVNVIGVKILELVVTDANDNDYNDHANWAQAELTYTGAEPVAVTIKFEPYILTPKAPQSPRINGAGVFGVKPQRPFLYSIAATGQRPVTFAAANLPAGLTLDTNTGIITGSIKEAGEFVVNLTVSNKLGKDKRDLKIVCGDTICLTPPLGWNSWNCWGCAVDETKIRKAADAMVSSGLINHGWTYINIDDCWHGKRDSNGKIQSNERFPNMKALADYVHSKGLKIGLYTDCGPKTCAGYVGSEGHEFDDIMTYAEWGFDYVKIDWCFCEGKNAAKTYAVFGDAIRQADRDIVFSICNWGGDKPWIWGASVGGNCWRTTGDIVDTWASIYTIGFGSSSISSYPKPGHWNDPDMLVIGKVGWGPSLRQSRLTVDEQYTHISLWSLLGAPLLIGCDMTQLDDFTYSLLTNDEVIAVDQDPLGKAASCIAKDASTQVWARDLADGSKAVGLFNMAVTPRTVTFKFADAGLTGKQIVRDLWKQQNIGTFADQYEIAIPRHGVTLLKLTPGNQQ